MRATPGRRPYTPGEGYVIIVRALRSLPAFRRSMRDGVLTPEFKERIMLAVTEVNGCSLCSYGHARMALESGMEASEIAALLAGEADGTPARELPAVLFAQHYAESRGNPTPESWARVQAEYGPPETLAILCAVRVIMLGNAYGLPLGSLKGRLLRKDGQIDERSSLSYELGMLALLVPFVPVAAVQALAAGIAKRPLMPGS